MSLTLPGMITSGLSLSSYQRSLRRISDKRWDQLFVNEWAFGQNVKCRGSSSPGSIKKVNTLASFTKWKALEQTHIPISCFSSLCFSKVESLTRGRTSIFKRISHNAPQRRNIKSSPKQGALWMMNVGISISQLLTLAWGCAYVYVRFWWCKYGTLSSFTKFRVRVRDLTLNSNHFTKTRPDFERTGFMIESWWCHAKTQTLF